MDPCLILAAIIGGGVVTGIVLVKVLKQKLECRVDICNDIITPQELL